MKKYRIDNIDKINIWEENNREYRKEYHDNYRNDNKEHISDYKKQYYKSNPEKANVTRKRRLDMVKSYLIDHPCVICGEDDIRCLAFHHVRGDKVDTICNMITRCYPIVDIEKEMIKCDVLCINCHLEAHYLPSSRYIGSRYGSKHRNLLYRDNYLSIHPCVDCGEDRRPVLQFHHTNDDKFRKVSSMISCSLDKLVAEINKCIVLCGNCHIKRTKGREKVTTRIG
jgi:hypothetical protein